VRTGRRAKGGAPAKEETVATESIAATEANGGEIAGVETVSGPKVLPKSSSKS
jgi:hypothetical protein